MFSALGQENGQQTAPDPTPKRIFGIIPNHRSSPSLVHYQPLAPKQKFKIATQDAFDRGTFVLAALFAGEGQLTNSNPSFGQGQGVRAILWNVLRRLGDWRLGDWRLYDGGRVPEPCFIRTRYFRRGTGSGRSRLRYAAAGQIIWTHSDSGGRHSTFQRLAGTPPQSRFRTRTTLTTETPRMLRRGSALRSVLIWRQIS